jgi:hypothetical protein
MPYYKFGPNDIFYNQIETHPQSEFLIYNGKTYYNNRIEEAGHFTSSVPHIPPGSISLYELNVDRDEDENQYHPTDNPSGKKTVIFPFITKGGSLTSFKTISTSEFNEDFQYGDIVTGSYPLSASITRKYYASQESTAEGEDITSNATGYTTRPRINALRNTFNYYTPMSDHYAFSNRGVDLSRTGTSDEDNIKQAGEPDRWDKDIQELNLISIPSIYYGSSIEKGTVDLKFYVKGQLVGHCRDFNKNGELIDIKTKKFSFKSIMFDGLCQPWGVGALNFGKPDTILISSADHPSGQDPSEHNTNINYEKITISAWIKKQGKSLDNRRGVYTIFSSARKLDYGNQRVDGYNAAGRKISRGTIHHDEPAQTFAVTEDNRLQIRQRFLDSATHKVAIWETARDSINNGDWTHVAAVYDRGTDTNNPVIYINGTSVSVIEKFTPTGTALEADLGSSIGNKDQFFGMPPWTFFGHIDEVSIWSGSLNSSQISEIYNGGLVDNLTQHSLYSSNLKHWWRMGESSEPGDTLHQIKSSGEASANYIIPDIVGGSQFQGYMKGFENTDKAVEDQFPNSPPSTKHMLSVIIQRNAPQFFKVKESGITFLSAPSALTSSTASSLDDTEADEDSLIAGVVLYNEGFIALTGSWNLNDEVASDYLDDGTSVFPKWTYFGARIPDGETNIKKAGANGSPTEFKGLTFTNELPDASFIMSFSGTNYVPVKTMLAHAPKGELNHSNNPTFVQWGAKLFDQTGSLGYFESDNIGITNTISSSHKHASASFDKQTYISKIGLYDDEGNLLGVTKLATPVRKKESDRYTFKIKLDF